MNNCFQKVKNAVLNIKLYFLVFLIGSNLGYSQIASAYFVHKKINLDSITNLYKVKKQDVIKNIPKQHAKYVNPITKEYDQKINNLKNLINAESLFINDSLNFTINQIINRVKANSNFITNDFTVFINGTPNPNAASWGHSILVFNAGLITKYKNIEELAFVVCHEMAHDYLNHNVKHIIMYEQVIKKGDFKSKYRAAKRKRYGKALAIKNVNEDFLLETTSFSRQDELQADSLGFVLFKNAGYQDFNAVNSLQTLKQVDDCFFNEPLDIKKEFSFSSYPFNNDWLNMTDVNSVYSKTIIEENDSLKTHPDCDIRIKQIIDQFKVDTLNTKNNFTTDKLIKNAFYENLNFCYRNENYLYTLYYALHLKQKYASNDYLKMLICHSLLEIGNSLKRHEFSYYVPLPNVDFDKDLNNLIGFLNNLSFTDYKELCQQFKNLPCTEMADSKHNIYTKLYAESFGLTKDEITNSIKMIESTNK
jgi:hypothetical protein